MEKADETVAGGRTSGSRNVCYTREKKHRNELDGFHHLIWLNDNFCWSTEKWWTFDYKNNTLISGLAA